MASLFSSLLNAGGSAPAETEEERARRLKMERYEQISASEVRRAARVREDAIPYLSLLARGRIDWHRVSLHKLVLGDPGCI